MAEAKSGDKLANLFMALALGAPWVGMLVLSLGVFLPKDSELAFWATVIAFPMLVLGLLLIVPLTNSDRSEV